MKNLDAIDKKLLDEIQHRFPVCSRPFAAVGEGLDMEETAVISRLRRLKKKGLIRRIGPVYDARACGLTTVLVALAVPEERVERVAALINAFDGVTHNYLRRHRYNIWFTLAARDYAEKRAILRAIRKRGSPEMWLDLPARKVFKIGLLFSVSPVSGEFTTKPIPGRKAPRRGRAPVQRKVIQAIPFDLPLVERPFPRGAVSAARLLLVSGRVRRFGAVLDEKVLGYRFSTLVAWKVEPARVAFAGERLSSFRLVSHCYERRKNRDWPYNLYTVIHAGSRREGLRLVRDMSRYAGITEYVVLETVRRLKRSSLMI